MFEQRAILTKRSESESEIGEAVLLFAWKVEVRRSESADSSA